MSDDNIVTFKGNQPAPSQEDEKYVFICGHCDNQTFNLFSDGTIGCAFCEHVMCASCSDPEQHPNWVKAAGKLPDDRSTIPEPDPVKVSTHHFQDTSFAFKRVWRTLKGWMEKGEIMMLNAYNKDGAGESWFGIQDEDDRQLMLGRLDAITKHVEKCEIGTEIESQMRFREYRDGDE
jgi:hypothetical protein